MSYAIKKLEEVLVSTVKKIERFKFDIEDYGNDLNITVRDLALAEKAAKELEEAISKLKGE
jgi:hypothetical protein